MKKLFFAFAAFAALFITSCQELVEPQEIEEQVISAYTFNFTVSGTDDATKAIKKGWEEGDIINLWFDGATGDPQAILTYDGESWTGTQLATDLVLGEDGLVSALYEGHNDLAKLRNNVPLVLENEKAGYLADDNMVYAQLNNWYYETPIQLVVPGITANYADYSLSCEDLTAGSWLFLYDRAVPNSDAHYTEMSISGAAEGKATTGVENADGAAFYFKSSNSTESKPYTFTLSYNGKDYTYTSGNTVIDATNLKNRVNKKLPEFTIDENGSPVSGCKWSLVGGGDDQNGYIKVTSNLNDWSGEYLLVYESDETTGFCWTGVDAVNCYASASIADNIISEVPSAAVTLIILPMDGGYSIMVNGSENEGKYIKGASGSNVLSFDDSAQLNTISYSDGSVIITSNTSVMRYNSASNQNRFRYIKSTTYTAQQAVQLYKSTKPYVVKQPQTLSFPESSFEVNLGDSFTAPTLSGAQTTVTYSSSNPGAATVDASTGAITIIAAGETTITATAEANDTYMQGSASYKLTVIDPNAGALKTILEIFEKSVEVGSSTVNCKVAFNNWVVSAVKGSNAYVTDGTYGFIIYKSGHGFVVGDVLSGTVNSCALTLFNGAAEFTNLTSSTTGLTVTKNGEVNANETLTIADLSGANTGALITLSGLTYNGKTLTDGTNTIDPYNTLYTGTYVTGQRYDVTGIYVQYKTTKEIAPRSADDIVEVTTPTYTITVAEGIENGTVTVSTASAKEYETITVTATPAEGYELDGLTVTKASGEPVSVSGNAFIMPASDVTVSATFEQSEGGEGGDAKTETLSTSEITTYFTNDKMAYATGETYVDGDITWNVYGYADATRPWMQLKKDAGVYVKITAPSNISEVRLTITSTSNSSGGIADITKHTAFSGYARLKSEDCAGDKSDYDICSSNNVENNTIVLSIPDPTDTEVYVKVSAGARIWGIEVDY